MPQPNDPERSAEHEALERIAWELQRMRRLFLGFFVTTVVLTLVIANLVLNQL